LLILEQNLYSKKKYIYGLIQYIMDLKKSEEANIDRLRTPIVFIGLLFVGSMVLASFSYTSAIADDSKKKTEVVATAVKFEQVEKPEDTPPPVVTPQVDAVMPPDDEIKVKENTEVEPTPIVAVIPEITIGEETVIVVQEEVIDFPDVEATFPGGAAALQQWIGENIQYPQTAIDMNDQGRVYLSFVVEPDGAISNIVVERGVSTELDREAKRVVRSMPNWTPGEAKGKKARTRCRLPINFTIN
jgi:protein TonB